MALIAGGEFGDKEYFSGLVDSVDNMEVCHFIKPVLPSMQP